MIRAFMIAMLTLWVGACAGGPPLPREAKGRPGLDYDALLAAPVRPLSAVQQQVIETATALVGAPYRFGGATPRGFDCSGYVQYVFREAAGVALPRTSIAQIQHGDPVSPRQLQPGDLVYFRIDRKRDLHLGIYVGDGRFIHAPSSGGVVNVQDLGMEYWRTRFLGARRVLDS